MGMPNSVADERQRLRDRLTQLDEERGHIAYALAVLDRLVPGAQSPSLAQRRAARSVRRKGTVGRPGGSYERAVRIIRTSDQAWRVDDLLPAMRKDGWSANVANEVETVRSALTRAVRDGLIDRTGVGLYAPKGWGSNLKDATDDVDADDGITAVAEDEAPARVDF